MTGFAAPKWNTQSFKITSLIAQALHSACVGSFCFHELTTKETEQSSVRHRCRKGKEPKTQAKNIGSCTHKPEPIAAITKNDIAVHPGFLEYFCNQIIIKNVINNKRD